MIRRSDRIILDTLLPGNVDPLLPLGLDDTGFESFWEKKKATLAPGLRLAFRMGLLAANWVSPLLVRRLPPLTRWERPVREQALRAMAASRFYLLRGAMQVLKLVTSMCYGANQQVRRALGYPLHEEAGGDS
jgi:hypothetical protein